MTSNQEITITSKIKIKIKIKLLMLVPFGSNVEYKNDIGTSTPARSRSNYLCTNV